MQSGLCHGRGLARIASQQHSLQLYSVLLSTDGDHCCQALPGLLGQFSQKNSAAGEKIRPQTVTPENNALRFRKQCLTHLQQLLVPLSIIPVVADNYSPQFTSLKSLFTEFCFFIIIRRMPLMYF